MPPRIASVDQLVFAETPRLVYWELTRACDLACKHCRAEAIAQRDPRELSTEEAKILLEELRAFGDPSPQQVMTGATRVRSGSSWRLHRELLLPDRELYTAERFRCCTTYQTKRQRLDEAVA